MSESKVVFARALPSEEEENEAKLSEEAKIPDTTVNERAAYSRYKERRAHIASFCVTGNNPRFLTDLTDNDIKAAQRMNVHYSRKDE